MYADPLIPVQRLIGAIGDAMGAVPGETLYGVNDGIDMERAPDAFLVWALRPVEAQPGLAMCDTASYLVTVDIYDVRLRQGDTETDATVSDRLRQAANVALDHAAWRGDAAVVRCDAVGFTVGAGDDLSDRMNDDLPTVTAGSVTIQFLMLC